MRAEIGRALRIMPMCNASLDLGYLLLHIPSKLWPKPGLVQLLCGRPRQIEPARPMPGIMQLSIGVPMAVSGSVVGLLVVMCMNASMSVVIPLGSMIACFAVPRLCVIGRLTVPPRFVPMLFAVTISTLLKHAPEIIMRPSSLCNREVYTKQQDTFFCSKFSRKTYCRILRQTTNRPRNIANLKAQI